MITVGAGVSQKVGGTTSEEEEGTGGSRDGRKDGPQAPDLSVFTEQTGGRRIRRKVILLNYLSKHYGSTVSHSMNLVLIQF